MGYPPHPHRNLVNIALDLRSDISKYLTNSGEIEILKILLGGVANRYRFTRLALFLRDVTPE